MLKKLCSLSLTATLFISVLASGSVSAQSPDYNYGEALQKALFFYDFQRSGELPEDQRDNWRGDSGLSDGADVGLDLTGGLYDAGDHVKFNLPMAYTSTMLAWSVYEDRQALQDSGQLEYITDTIKWVTDYLIKCHPEPNVFYYQVGDGNLDHAWWGPAEVMQMSRPAYKVDLSKPGSTVSAEAAAALSSAALVFADSDPAYAQLLIQHAEELFNFADTTKSDAGYTAASGFYNSWSGFYDQLSWAGVWLYLATGDTFYLNKAESYVGNWGTEPQTSILAYKWAHCWDDVHNGAALLLAKITNKPVYIEATEMHLDYWTTGYNGSRVSYTPKGLAWLDSWGALRYATTTAFLAGVYADWANADTQKAQTYKTFAKQQVDYALGSSGRSYVVGFGEDAPEHPHHRTAHSSWADSLSTPDYHRHTIVGALVGGPNRDDSYSDDITNYTNNEVADDYNAGFVGVLAKMYKWYGGEPLDSLTAFEEVTNDEFFVEAGVNASGPNFVEIKSLMYNQTGWPARVGDKLSFKYYIDISEGIARGYSAADYTVSTNYNAGATVSKLLPWDEANHIYYVLVDFTGTKIYPGGQSAFKKEVQFRIAAPQNTTFWDSTNDFSYQEISGQVYGKAIKTVYIPVYDNGTKVFGYEPGSAQNNSTITPTTAQFDKYLPNRADITVAVNYNGNQLISVKNGSAALQSGLDYTVGSNQIILSKDYLSTLPSGENKLTFAFSEGASPVLTVSVVDSTPSASITPTSAVFDLSGEPQSVFVDVQLNGHELTDIRQNGSVLVPGEDYTFEDGSVELLPSWLAQNPVGESKLTFVFSGGNNSIFTLKVIDSSIVVSGEIRIDAFNGNTSSFTNGIAPRLKITNTGDEGVNFADIKLRYYYTVDGDKPQNFWCDWSSAGSSNVVGTFVPLGTPVSGADYYLEISFTNAAGTLAPNQSAEVQVRFSKNDWTNYNQADDYSFNASGNQYVASSKITGFIDGVLVWGTEP